MVYIIDTHTLVWYLEESSKLSSKAAILEFDIIKAILIES